VGLGKKGNYEIKNNGVTVHVNLNVTMRAGDVERAIIENANSIIRDRLEFATDRYPDKKADRSLATQIASPSFPTAPDTH